MYNLTDLVNRTAFVLVAHQHSCISGMCGRFYILHEIFMGAAGGVAGECSQATKESFQPHALHRDSGLVYVPDGL